MERDLDRFRLFTRRALVVGGAQLGLTGLLVARLSQLQLEEAAKYAEMAEENRIDLRMVAPSRGLVTDRRGEVLAGNLQNFRVVAVREQAGDLEAVLRRLAREIRLDDADIQRVLKEAARRRRFVPVLVRENLSWEEVSRVSVLTPELPGLSIEAGEARSYPFGAVMAHVLGYVGSPSEADLQGDADPVLTLPDVKIGKAGIERSQDARLRGRAGVRQLEVNAVGRVIRELAQEAGTPGDTVTLTLDMRLQNRIDARLKQEVSAAATVMDVHTGAIYALVSYPSFDPNLFTKTLAPDTWDQLINDPTSPLNNKAIAGAYPPGSTFKMVTALAALEAGAIGLGHVVSCPGYMMLGDHKFHCWRTSGHGSVNLRMALAQSCDCFFWDVGRRVGIDQIAQTARKLGLGERFGFDVPGERAGLIPDRAWKQRARAEPWMQGDTFNASIGQGFVKATPLQLAVMTARLVNGGRAIEPHLVMRASDRMTSMAEPMGFQSVYLRAIQEGMVAVCQVGSAARAQIQNPAWAMGGKTGTAQVKRITAAERAAGIKQEDLPWKLRHHALFVGFAPISAPRYACAVIVEHGGGGASVAAPVARDILAMTQELDPATPVQAAFEPQARGPA